MAQQSNVTICERLVDNRSLIEAVGKDVVISSVLSNIESTLARKPNIEEVRFVAGNLLTIDSALEHKVWHGRNVVLYAHKIEVVKPVCWNLSGRDSDHVYEENAGTDADGRGTNGKDGYPGASGGNVYISAKSIDHWECLNIVSNGGNGSKGQDGGNGKAGEDGVGISREEFSEKFPNTARLSGNDCRKAVKQTSSSLESLSAVIKTNFQDSLFRARTFYDGHISYINLNETKFYVHIETHSGGEIIFSFREISPFLFVVFSQSYLLYKGSPGKAGKPGGESGLGGEGGFPGEIVVDCWPMQSSAATYKGKDGENGKGGLYGQHGKDGWDMGYLDSTWTNDFPEYYGTNENSKLTLKFHDSVGNNRVYCNYKSSFVTITSSPLEHKQVCKERNNARTRNDKQHHARAVRNNIISKTRIQEAYSKYVKTVQKTINDEKERHRAAVQAAERKRIAQEAAEKERIAQEAAVMERIAREAAERERIAQEAAEKQRIAREAAEKERIAQEAAERERIAQEAAERERIAQEALEDAKRERIAREEAEKYTITRSLKSYDDSKYEEANVYIVMSDFTNDTTTIPNELGSSVMFEQRIVKLYRF